MGLTHQHQHVEHSCLFGEDGGHDQLGMRDRPWMIDCGGLAMRLEREWIGVMELEVEKRWSSKSMDDEKKTRPR